MNCFRTILAGLIFFALPGAAFAATLGVAPATASVHAGDIVTVRLVANTQGVAINQGEATLRFPVDMLDAVSASKSGSIFTLWVEEPAYSNVAGTVHFDGGVPTPGYTGAAGTVLTVTFHAKKAGTATLTLSDAALRANDGLGTNVLSASSGSTITIADAVVTPAPLPSAPAAPAAPTAAASGAILGLTSPTHSDQNVWYQNGNPLMTWQLPAGATAVQTIVDRSADTPPTVSYKPPIVEKRITELADGVWYFNIRARTAAGAGPVASYKLQIDSTPPSISHAKFVYDSDERTLLISGVSASDSASDSLMISDVAATDAVSGIERFELSIDGNEPLVIPAADLDAGVYTYAFSKPGTHIATLSAIDRAGNHSETSDSFAVPTSLANQTLWNLGGMNITFGWFIALILLISLFSLIAAATAWYRLYMLHAGAKSRIEKRDKLLHRSLRIYKEELERHLRTLERAGTKRDLTDEEADLNEDLRKNVDDLERYLSKEFKKYD